MGALKSFVELKTSGEDEIEQKEPLLRKFDLLKASGCGGNKQSAVSPSEGGVYKCCGDYPKIFMNLIFSKTLLKGYFIFISLQQKF